MNVREAIETIGMQRLAELAGCTRTTMDRTKQRGGGLFYEPDRILLRDFMIGCIRPALHQIGGMVDEPAKLKLGEKKRDSALAM